MRLRARYALIHVGRDYQRSVRDIPYLQVRDQSD